MATNYLFFSLQCPHSRQLLQKLKGHPICQGINFVNIDDPRVNVPAFVQVVPTLFIASLKKVITDGELINWVDNMVGGSNPPRGSSLSPNQTPQMHHPQQSNTISISSITGDDSILPFVGSEMLGGSSMASYSFIDDGANEQMGHNFGFLDDRDTSKIPMITRADAANSNNNTPGISGSRTGRNNGIDKEYERMMSQRAADVPKPMAHMRM